MRVAPSASLCVRTSPKLRALSSMAGTPLSTPTPRGASSALRSLVVRAKAEPIQKAKVGPGSIVPWADPSVQRMFQLGTTPIDWENGAKILSRQTTDTKGIIAFAKAEVEAKGAEALVKEGQNMPQYAVSRSLFIEVWLSLAASRAGVTSPTDRRALGLVYSQMNVDSDKNAFDVFAIVLKDALAGPSGSVAAILPALIADVKSVAAALTDEDRGKVKQSSKTGYDSSVTEATLKAIAASTEAALAALPAAPPALTVVPLLIPALRDPGKESLPTVAPANKPKAGGFGAKLLEAKQKLPDFSTILKKQQRPGFVELASWAVAEDKVTASEAVGLLVDFVLMAREKLGKPLLLVLPGAFMVSIVTLGTGKLTADVHVVAVGDELPKVAEGTVAVVAAFSPAPVDGPLDGPAGVRTVAALKAAGFPIVVAAVARVTSAAAAIDPKEREAAVEKAAAWARPEFAA